VLRFFHRTSEPILDFVGEFSLNVFKVGLDGHQHLDHHEISSASPNAVQKALEDSKRLWGVAADYCLLASPLEKAQAADVHRLSVGDFLSHEFLLLPYSDGGLISFSSTALPFQNEPAEWWPAIKDVGQ
jgi:hypothetical protein